jgi:hypothetical protein
VCMSRVIVHYFGVLSRVIVHGVSHVIVHFLGW